MPIAPRIDYISLLAYFTAVPDAVGELVYEARHALAEIVGNPVLFANCMSRADSGSRADIIKSRERLLENDLRERLNQMLIPSFWARAHTKNSQQYREYGVVETSCSVEFDPKPVMRGRPVPPSFRIDVNLSRLKEEQWSALCRLAQRFSELVAATNVLGSGLIDCADFYETSAGHEYSGTGIGWTQFQRKLGRYCWIDAGVDRVHRARGIFWGNILGQSMLDALGGPDPFLGEYAKLVPDKRDACLSQRLPNGAALVLLSDDLSLFTFPYQSADDRPLVRAAWLHRRFREADLLI